MLYRLRFTGDVTEAGLRARLSRFAALERTWEYVELTRQLLRLAALPTITPVKALDAIHIASAIILRDQLGEPITFATHDRQQAAAARTLGFEVVGV